MNRNIYRLFFIRRMGWCFDDGHGLYTNIKRVINGRLTKNNDLFHLLFCINCICVCVSRDFHIYFHFFF